MIENLIEQSDRIMCIGGMAYTFLKVSQGMAIGSSLFDKKGAEMVPRLLEKAKAKGCELVFPCDWLCGEEFKNEQPNGTKSVTQAEGIPVLGWVTMKPKPCPFIKDTIGSAQFYTNRVLKDFKDKDPSQVANVSLFRA